MNQLPIIDNKKISNLTQAESAKSRGWRGFVGGVGSMGAWVRGSNFSVVGVGSVLHKILVRVTWVTWIKILAWVTWVHNILAWVPWIEILAWVKKQYG